MVPTTLVIAWPYLTMPIISQFLNILFIAITKTIAQRLLIEVN